MIIQPNPIRELKFIRKTLPAFQAHIKRRESQKFEMFLSNPLERKWISELGKEAEGAVRFVLSPDLSFSEKKVMRFSEFRWGKWWGPNYRELDLLHWIDSRTPLVIEVKSCTPRSFHKQLECGIRQSEINLQILESKFPSARAALILVNRSVVPLPECGDVRLAKMESAVQFYEIEPCELAVMFVDAPSIGLSYVDGQHFHVGRLSSLLAA